MSEEKIDVEKARIVLPQLADAARNAAKAFEDFAAAWESLPIAVKADLQEMEGEL